MMARLFLIVVGAFLVLRCVALPIPSEDVLDAQVSATELPIAEHSVFQSEEPNSATTQAGSLTVMEVASPETATETIESQAIASTQAPESSNDNLNTPQADSSLLELPTTSLSLDLQKEQATELVEPTDTSSVPVESNEQQISDASETVPISAEPHSVSDSSEPDVAPTENGIPETLVTEAVESEHFAATITSEISSDSNVTEIAITQSIELDPSLAASSESKPATSSEPELSNETEESQPESVTTFKAETSESLASEQSDEPETTTLSKIASELPESPTLATSSNEPQSSDSSAVEATQVGISDTPVTSAASTLEPAPEQPESSTLAPLEQVVLSDEPKPSDSIVTEVVEPENIISLEITTTATEPQPSSATTISPESEVTEPLQTETQNLPQNKHPELVISAVSTTAADQSESSTLPVLEQVTLSDEPVPSDSQSDSIATEIAQPENIPSPEIQMTTTESVTPEPQSPSVTTLSPESSASSETKAFVESGTQDLPVTQQPEPEPSTTLPSESQPEETPLTESTTPSVPQVSSVQSETESVVEPHQETISEASFESPQPELIVSSTEPVAPTESSNSDSNVAENTQTQSLITSNADEPVIEAVNSEQQSSIASTFAPAAESEPESPTETLLIENTITAQPEIVDSSVSKSEPESSSQEVSIPNEANLEESTVLADELPIITQNINQQQEPQILTTQSIIESAGVSETIPLSSIASTEEGPQTQTELNDLAEQKSEPALQTEESPEATQETQNTLTEQLKPLEDEAKVEALETPTLPVVNDNSIVQLSTVASVESNDPQVTPVTTSESEYIMVEVPRQLAVNPEADSNQLASHQTLQELSSSIDNLNLSSGSSVEETVTHETESIQPTTQMPTPESPTTTGPVTESSSPTETSQLAISETARPVPTSTAVIQDPTTSVNSSIPERKVFISSISRQIRTFKPPVKDQVANTTWPNTLSSASIVQARSSASSRAISLILATILTMLYYVISQ